MDIGLPHQKVLNVKIGDLGLKPVKPLSVIQGRMTTSCLTRTMSSEDNLDREDMVAADDHKNFFGDLQTDTIGNVSQFFATYPDKDCILFHEGLVPGEGFHHLLMYSLLTVFPWVPVKRGSACS